MKKFTVDRRTWLRGEGDEVSFLLRPIDGKMCCLGQICLQIGIPQETISSVRTPNDPNIFPTFNNEVFAGYNTISTAMTINDNTVISDSEREESLKELFSEHDIELVFEN